MYPRSNIQAKEGGILQVPIAKIGRWYHKLYGEVKFTEEDFDNIIKNFRHGILGHTPYLTFGHEKEDNLTTIDAEKKKGDMIGFSQVGDTLFGLFKATKDAYNSVTSGDYEFSSGEFIRGFMDKASGENRGTTLMRVSLTNSPFIPNFETVQALSQNEDNKTNLVFTMNIDKKQQDIEDNVPTNTQQELSTIAGEVNPVTSPVESPTETQLSTTKEDIKDEFDKVDENKESLSETLVEDKPSTDNSSLDQNNLAIEDDSKKPTNMKTTDTNNLTSIPEKSQAQTPPLSYTGIDIDTLVEDVSTKIGKKYERTIKDLEGLVNDLQNQLVKKEEVLRQTASVTQAQAMSLSQAQSEVMKAQERIIGDYLLGEGVSPVLVQKFSQLREAIISNSSVLKLSQSDGEEKEVSIIQALSDLLVDAVNTPSVPGYREQYGASIGYDTSGSYALTEQLIRRNRQRALEQLAK